jgi:hypothetical protein
LPGNGFFYTQVPGKVKQFFPFSLLTRFVWNPGDGSELPASLKEAGIGDISIQAVRSAFSLKDDFNALIGQIQKSGLYLTESVQPGLIQQLDSVART